jgi:hypothetical protein
MNSLHCGTDCRRSENQKGYFLYLPRKVSGKTWVGSDINLKNRYTGNNRFKTKMPVFRVTRKIYVE